MLDKIGSEKAEKRINVAGKQATFCDNAYTLVQMTKRHLKLFLKDKVTVFFSLLAPLIVFGLYMLFLGDIQVNAVSAAFEAVPKEFMPSDKAIKAFADSWMISGTLSVACITVALSANSVMVQDRQRGVINDAIASPVKSWVITLSYFVFNFVVTFLICLAVFALMMLYLAISGGFFLSILDILAILGLMVGAVISSTLITVFVARYIKTESALSGIVGIMSAAIGFLIGAYMPLDMFPTGIQYICNIVPGSHAAGIFRNIFMRGSMANLVEGLPTGSGAIESLSETFSLKINFFGLELGVGGMAIVLALSAVIFLVLNLCIKVNYNGAKRILLNKKKV